MRSLLRSGLALLLLTFFFVNACTQANQSGVPSGGAPVSTAVAGEGPAAATREAVKPGDPPAAGSPLPGRHLRRRSTTPPGAGPSPSVQVVPTP